MSFLENIIPFNFVAFVFFFKPMRVFEMSNYIIRVECLVAQTLHAIRRIYFGVLVFLYNKYDYYQQPDHKNDISNRL